MWHSYPFVSAIPRAHRMRLIELHAIVAGVSVADVRLVDLHLGDKRMDVLEHLGS